MVDDMNSHKGISCSQDENTAIRKGDKRRTVSNAEVIVVHDSDSEEELSSGSLSQIVRENEDQTHPTITDSPVISSSDWENQEEVLGEASDEKIPRPLTPPPLRNVPVTLHSTDDDEEEDDDDDDDAEASDEKITRPLTPPPLRNVPVTLHSTDDDEEEEEEEEDDDDDDHDEDAEASDEEIPRPLTPPRLRNVPVTLPVLFDLETTGLETDSHILQIAAWSPGNSFCRYVRPKRMIDFFAQLVHGLSFDGRILYLHEEPVDSVNIRQALSDFLEFLGDGPVTLFGHNAKRFDCPILINAVKACNLLPEYERKISGFVDTLPLFRDVCPGLPSYRQFVLYEHFFHESYTVHEAVSDVEALKKLLQMPCVTPEAISRYCFCFDYILQAYRRLMLEWKMFPSWNFMIKSGSVKLHMAKRAAGSGLGVHHLRMAYKKDGETGVQDVLQHPNSEGKPRVTKNKRVLTQITSYIAQNPIEDNFKILREGGSWQTDYIDGDEGHHGYDNDFDFVGEDGGDEGHREYNDDRHLMGDDGEEGHVEYDDDRNLVDDGDDDDGDGDKGHHECDGDRNLVDDDDAGDGDKGHHECDDDRNLDDDDDDDDDEEEEEGHHECDDDSNVVDDDDGDEGHHEHDRHLLGDDADRRRVGGSDGHHCNRPRPDDKRKNSSDNSSDDDEYPTRKKFPKISHQEVKETLGKDTSRYNCSIA